MSITSMKTIHCNVRNFKPLTCKPNKVVNPLYRILGTRLQDLIQDRYLLRAYNGWSLPSLFFLEESTSENTPTMVNYVQNLYTQINFNILTGSKYLKSQELPYLVAFGLRDKGPGAQLAEQKVRNAVKTFTENHLERYLVDKERFERRPGSRQAAGSGWTGVPSSHGWEPGKSNLWRIAEKVFSRTMAIKRIMETHKTEYFRIPEQENEIQLQRTLSRISHNVNQEDIIKEHFLLSGKKAYRNWRADAQELALMAPASTDGDYSSGYARRLPAYESSERASAEKIQHQAQIQQQQQQQQQQQSPQREQTAQKTLRELETQPGAVHGKAAKGKREGLYERYSVKRYSLKRITEAAPNSILITSKSAGKIIGQSEDSREENYLASSPQLKSGSGPNAEIAYYEAQGDSASSTLTSVNLPEAGMEYEKTASESVRKIIRQTFRESREQHVEKQVQNVFRTFAVSRFFKQAGGNTPENSLIQNYLGFKSELTYIRRQGSRQAVGSGYGLPSVSVSHGWREGIAGGPNVRHPLENGMTATGKKYLPELKKPGGNHLWRIAEKVFSRTMAINRIMETHKTEYFRIPEQENEIQLQRTLSRISHNVNQEDIIKEHFLLSGKKAYRDWRADAQELALMAPASTDGDYSSGYVRRLPAYESSERASAKKIQHQAQIQQQQQSPQREQTAQKTLRELETQPGAVHGKAAKGKREGLYERYSVKRYSLKRITEAAPNSILITSKSAGKIIGQSEDSREENYLASSPQLKSGSGPNAEIAYYEAQGDSASSTLTPVNLPEAGMEYEKTASESVRKIIRQTFRESREQHVEKQVQNNVFWAFAVSRFFKQAGGNTPENSLIQNYLGFKSELTYIKRPGSRQAVGSGHGLPSVSVSHGWREGIAGGPNVRHPLENGMTATGKKYLPELKKPGGNHLWRIAEEVFSRTMAIKRIMETHKTEYFRIPEQENEIQLQRTLSRISHNVNQEDIIKEHFLLSGKKAYRDWRADAQELALMAPASTDGDYSLGYARRLPAYESSERASAKKIQHQAQIQQQQQSPQREETAQKTLREFETQLGAVHGKAAKGKREGLYERYSVKRYSLKRITEAAPNSILITSKSAGKIIGQSEDSREENYLASSPQLKSGSGPDAEIAYYEAQGDSASSTLTPVNLPEAGMEYEKTASESVRKIIRQTFQGPRAQLVEKLVQNVVRTFRENRLERYLVDKERFEKTLSKNPFFKQAEENPQENGLIQSYLGFKSELAYIRRLGRHQALGVSYGWPSVPVSQGRQEEIAGDPHKAGIPKFLGGDAQLVLKISEAGMEYLPAVKIPGDSNFWRIAEKIFTRITEAKQVLRMRSSRILERENGIQLRKTQSVLTNIDNQEAIIKRREEKHSILKHLQNKDHLVLSGKVNYQDSRAGALEFVMPPLTSPPMDYSAGYTKNMPPITHKSGEQLSAKQSQQQELVVRSLNTPTDTQIQTRTIKKSVDMDLNSTQLSNLVDKVYAQLESKLAWERRRYGY